MELDNCSKKSSYTVRYVDYMLTIVHTLTTVEVFCPHLR